VRHKVLAAIFLAAAAAAAQTSTDPLRIWVGNPDPAGVTAWVQSHLDKATKQENTLLTVSGARTVTNTLAPYDEADRALSTAARGAHLLNAAGSTKELRDTAQAESRRVSAASTELSLNRAIYDRLASIDIGGVDADTKFYLAKTLRDYRLQGVDKDEATRKQIRSLRDQITNLVLQFNRNIAEGTAHIEVKSVSELDGLPADYIARHKPDANGVITLTTDEPDYRPVMEYARSTELRHRLFDAYNERCYPANRDVLLKMLTLRAQLAHLLGFTNYADYAAADKMIGSAANIRSLITELDKVAAPARAREMERLIAYAKTQDPSLTSIPEYSARYWLNQYETATYNFDSQSVRAYFPFAQVQEGVLSTASRLFHVHFTVVPGAPTWDPSVTVLDVTDGREAGGKKLGRIYLDMHPRPGKDKWFNAGPVVLGKRGIALPEARLNGNFTGGENGDPGLMQYDDVVTFFHEFGHMMHMVLGGNQQYAGTGPLSLEWDFIEAPSQMLEEFFASRSVLAPFAHDYKTNQPMPEALFNNMIRADAFDRGIQTERQLMYASFALHLHDRDPSQVDPDALLAASYKQYSAFTEDPANRMYATFTHLTGYASNYYTYQLSKVIALDFFTQFDPANLLDGPTALRYRKAVLEPGGSVSANTLVKNFLGRPQQYEAMREWINKDLESSPAK
jgi:thimet oligopeptidase